MARIALRAVFVEHAERWHRGTFYRRSTGNDQWLTSKWTVPRPIDEVEQVDQPMPKRELQAMDACIHGGREFGRYDWIQDTDV